MEHFLAEIESRAFRIAHLATGNREDALDIVQDAMIKLVQKYSGHDKNSWKPLFYRILESKIFDFHRRKQVRNRFRSWLNWNSEDEDHEDILSQFPAATSSAPDMQVEGTHFMQDLNMALAKLPLRQQQAFLLRIWEGLDINETAIAMQCSESSVKTHYARAMDKLRETLKDHQ